MRCEFFALPDLALADDQNGCQRGKAGAGVHHDASGKIGEAHLRQETASPNPVSDGRIDKDTPQDQKDQVALEADPICERAGDQGRRDDRKHFLENKIRRERNRLRGTRNLQGGGGHALQGEVLERIPDNAADVLAVHEAESAEDPDDRDDTHRDEALHHDGQDILAADKAPIEEGQSRRHKHDQGRADEHQGGRPRIDVVHLIASLSCWMIDCSKPSDSKFHRIDIG